MLVARKASKLQNKKWPFSKMSINQVLMLNNISRSQMPFCFQRFQKWKSSVEKQFPSIKILRQNRSLINCSSRFKLICMRVNNSLDNEIQTNTINSKAHPTTVTSLEKPLLQFLNLSIHTLNALFSFLIKNIN